MSQNFINAYETEQNYTYTANGAKVYKSSLNSLVDMYFKSESLRNAHQDKIIKSLGNSYADDKLLTLKLLFHLRDIRQGQGLRYYFRTAINHLAKTDSNNVRCNINLFAEYGRWDDLIALMNTPVERDMLDLIDKQLKEDINSKHPSLLAKWLPKESTKNADKKRWCSKILRHLGIDGRTYRKKYLVPLRKKLNVIERYISIKSYGEIDYSKIPSQAMMRYRHLFYKYDEARFTAYIESLKKDDTKVNASTLYPYQISEKLRHLNNDKDIDLMNEMWKALPNYIEGSSRAIPVIDVSGSMYSTSGNGPEPIDVALSLGIYMAERNEGVFKNKFFTFSSSPKLETLKGNTLYEKIKNLENEEWGFSTDFEKVFKTILNTAIKYNLTQEDLPERVICISDMHFNNAARNSKDEDTLMDTIKNMYEEKGYKMPKLIFWNVDQDPNSVVVPMVENENGLGLVSGCSPSIFEAVIKGDFKTPVELIMEIIDTERYEPITITD